MTFISISDRWLEIEGERIELAEEINQVIVVEDVVLVRCKSGGELDPTNLIAFDKEGNKLWRIDPLKKHEDDSTRPIKGIHKNGDFIQVLDRDGDRYKIEPKQARQSSWAEATNQ